MFCLDTTRLKNTQNNAPTSSFNSFKYMILMPLQMLLITNQSILQLRKTAY